MGENIITPVNAADSTSNITGPKPKAQILKEYYEFFNYKDPNAWGSQDLMDKYLDLAAGRDFHSRAAANKPDGYLSKKEYEIFLQFIMEKEDKKKFQEIEITELDKRVIHDNRIYEAIDEDHPAVTEKDKKILQKLNSIGAASVGVGIKGLSIIGLIPALSSLLGIWGYTAHINNKIEKYDAQQQENQTEIQNSEGQ